MFHRQIDIWWKKSPVVWQNHASLILLFERSIKWDLVTSTTHYIQRLWARNSLLSEILCPFGITCVDCQRNCIKVMHDDWDIGPVHWMMRTCSVIFHQMFLCSHEGWQRYGFWMLIVIAILKMPCVNSEFFSFCSCARLWLLLGDGLHQCSGGQDQHQEEGCLAHHLPVCAGRHWLWPCWVLWRWRWPSCLRVCKQERYSGWDLQQLPG